MAATAAQPPARVETFLKTQVGHADHRVLNKEVVLASRPRGKPSEGNFAVRGYEFPLTCPIPGSRDVIAKTLWVSVDPYLRERMNATNPIGMQPFEINKPIQSHSLSKVIASDNVDFQEGDVVYGVTNVAEYVVVPAGQGIEKVDVSSIPPSCFLGILGMPGHTAWVGFHLIAQAKPNDTVFISAASGAVGLAVGQFAKNKGCRVVGSAGSNEKIKVLKESYDFDDAFNYKEEEDWDLTLKRLFPNGIDVYYENVGGPMLEAVLNNINVKGRIAACGMVSQYNKPPEEANGIRNLMMIIGKCVKLEGFIISHYMHTRADFLKEVMPLVQQGKIKYKETVLGRGIEEFPKAFIKMFDGENIGKALVHVSND